MIRLRTALVGGAAAVLLLGASGSTAVAAVDTERHYVGYEVDASYIELARARLSR